jgi:anti-sigma factor RsiW
MNEHTHQGMTCDELLQALNEYVDNESLSAACQEFAEHLAGCNPCQIVVDNIRNTIKLYQDGKPYPIPAEFSKRLNAALASRWREKFPATR